MRPWMLEAPPMTLDDATRAAFRAALDARDETRLPSGTPRWAWLQWLAERGFLLHGSNRADLAVFEPRTPHDLSPDEFSKRTAVFAASDGVWAMMYALTDRAKVKRVLNTAVQVRHADGWSTMRYFLSLAPREEKVTDGRSLLRGGSVYVLPRDGFERMPPYEWPGLGDVLEPHWANPRSVTALFRVSVAPADFPLPVRTHDADRVDALCRADPWGFPWLDVTNDRSALQ